MRLKMNDEKLQTLEEVERFIEGSQPLEFEGVQTSLTFVIASQLSSGTGKPS